MPQEAVKNLFKDAKDIGVRSIAIIGEGENTLHPDLPDIVDYGRNIDLDLSLATNGIRIDHNQIEKILGGLRWLRINISAANPTSFKLIHKVDMFGRVISNIEALVRSKRLGNHNCTIGIQMVVMRENMDQIVPLARLGGELGVDYLVVKSCSDTYDGLIGGPREEYRDIEHIFHEAESISRDDYTVSIKWSKLNNGGWKDYDVCFGTQFIIAISADGSVFPCGHWFNIRRDEFKMGNVIDTPFSKIFASDRYWDIQKKIQSVNVNKDCESNCRQHYINQFLSSVSKEPVHKNFI